MLSHDLLFEKHHVMVPDPECREMTQVTLEEVGGRVGGIGRGYRNFHKLR